MTDIDISGLDKAELLAALFNASHALGMGRLQNYKPAMTLEEARELLAEHKRFDYVRGRVLKVDLSKDSLFTALYNRDNGPGAAEAIVARLRDASAKQTGRTTRMMEAAVAAAKQHGVAHVLFAAGCERRDWQRSVPANVNVRLYTIAAESDVHRALAGRSGPIFVDHYLDATASPPVIGAIADFLNSGGLRWRGELPTEGG